MRHPLTLFAGLVLGLAAAGALNAATPEQAFLKDNGAAMDRMMAGMAVRPSGDIDADFVSLMEPHHQGGIDMAELELRYGRNEQLRRLAQEIIVEQQQEIAAMRLALGRPLPASAPAPTQPTPTQPTPMAMPDGMVMHASHH